jgi:hypothetical protein
MGFHDYPSMYNAKEPTGLSHFISSSEPSLGPCSQEAESKADNSNCPTMGGMFFKLVEDLDLTHHKLGNTIHPDCIASPMEDIGCVHSKFPSINGTCCLCSCRHMIDHSLTAVVNEQMGGDQTCGYGSYTLLKKLFRT